MKNLNRSFRCALAFLLAGGLVAGCATSSQDASRAQSNPTHNESRLRSGDPITVRVDYGGNQAPTSLDVTIDENGEISLPLINHIKAASLTPAGLAERIEANYVPRFYVRVTVTVLATMRFFYMGGEIRSPGRLNWTEDVTILKAINMAGGFTDFANRGKVQLSRGGTNMIFNAEALREHPDKDFMIQPGDSLYVPRSIF